MFWGAINLRRAIFVENLTDLFSNPYTLVESLIFRSELVTQYKLCK